MSDALVSGSRPVSFGARNARGLRSADSAPAKPGLWRRLRTMGGVNLRGIDIEITPAEIEEDLRYGRD